MTSRNQVVKLLVSLDLVERACAHQARHYKCVAGGGSRKEVLEIGTLGLLCNVSFSARMSHMFHCVLAFNWAQGYGRKVLKLVCAVGKES